MSTRKRASALIPGQNQPSRTGVRKESFDVDHDPYQAARNASLEEQDQLWQALMTEAGRQAVGAQMAIPIRTQLDYQGVARRFFEIDVLAQGQIARYDKDIDVTAYTVSKRGEPYEHIVEGEYVEPATWEIFAPASLRLSEIQQRRFNILDRTQEKIRISMQEQEDEEFLALIDTTTTNNTGSNPITTSTGGVTKSFLNDLSAEVQKWDLPAYAFLMNFQAYKDLRDWNSTDVDPVTQREIQETGLYGQIWGIDIIVSRKVPDNTVYCFSEPRFFGVLPIRTDVILMPNDEPRKARIGYVGYEEIGMLVANSLGVSKGIYTG